MYGKFIWKILYKNLDLKGGVTGGAHPPLPGNFLLAPFGATLGAKWLNGIVSRLWIAAGQVPHKRTRRTSYENKITTNTCLKHTK